MSESKQSKRVGLIIGSLREHSINRKLARAMVKMMPSLTFDEIRIHDLPLYDQDDDDHPSESARLLKGNVQAVQGLLFVTPEYNRSIPGVLKNAIDHASRPYGQNAWAGKPAGILSASIGSVGGAAAQQHLRNILAYLDVPTLGQPEAFIHIKDDFFAENGEIANATSRKFLQSWADRFASWLNQFSA